MDVTTLLIAIACLLVGAALGVLLSRALSPQQKKQRELEETLQRAEDRHRLYQQDVTEHFTRSARMLRELSHNYRTLGEQFAEGAMRLSTPEVSRQVLEATSPTTISDTLPHTWSDTPAEPPRDYAPSAPGGVLSEHYGLDEQLNNPFSSNNTQNSAANISHDAEVDKQRDDPTYRLT